MKYELTLTRRSKENDFTAEFEKLEANDLVELLSQFVLLVAGLHRKEMEEEITRRLYNDDVPF